MIIFFPFVLNEIVYDVLLRQIFICSGSFLLSSFLNKIFMRDVRKDNNVRVDIFFSRSLKTMSNFSDKI